MVLRREALPSVVPAITPAVIGIMGYTQGVRLVSTPAPKSVATQVAAGRAVRRQAP
jgi:hypothetical protein